MPDPSPLQHLTDLLTNERPLTNAEWRHCWQIVAEAVLAQGLEPEDPRFPRVLQLLNALDYHYRRKNPSAFAQTSARLADVLRAAPESS